MVWPLIHFSNDAQFDRSSITLPTVEIVTENFAPVLWNSTISGRRQGAKGQSLSVRKIISTKFHWNSTTTFARPRRIQSPATTTMSVIKSHDGLYMYRSVLTAETSESRTLASSTLPQTYGMVWYRGRLGSSSSSSSMYVTLASCSAVYTSSSSLIGHRHSS